ncbi:MAG TPA: hypothetical protein VE591_07125 [Candidatus Acidoferrum sp.]|nr:hypothetical protein [Candidatus Acidoferrum sp.]
MSSAAPPRDATLDLLIGIVGLWLAAGFLWDSWAHMHVAVETFFTPYHAIFYAAMLAGAAILVLTALRNRARGFRGRNLFPTAYQLPLLGVPIFFLGGIGDLIWHTIFGIEDRIDAVTSPTHLVIGFGVLLVMSGPMRSALEARGELRSLRDYLPLIFALATWLEFIHLGTAYAFDPSAARADAPPNDILYSPDYFTNVTLVLYKTGSGVVVVMLQSAILMIFALWLVSRFALPAGALTLLFVLGNGMIAAAITNDTPLLATYLVMSLAAGIVADAIVARFRPSPSRLVALRLFGLIVPVVYYLTYFAVTLAWGGTWWDWNLMLGALVWSGCFGVGLSLLVGGRVTERTTKDV